MMLGAGAVVALMLAGGAVLLHAAPDGPKEQHHRTLKLASGRTVEVTTLYLGFGDEHSGRGAIDDGVGVEYVATSPEPGARDREAAEVFDAIRPLVESLGVPTASIAAFPSLVRKGRYDRYDYTRDAGGAWTPRHVDAKLSAND